MNNVSFTSVARKVRISIDTIAASTYKRTEFGTAYINGAMKELLMLAGIVQKLDIEESTKKEILTRWNGYFINLGKALEKKDFILAADILHHDFVNELKTWEKGDIQ